MCWENLTNKDPDREPWNYLQGYVRVCEGGGVRGIFHVPPPGGYSDTWLNDIENKCYSHLFTAANPRHRL